MRVQERISRVENKVDVLVAKLDAFVEEMRKKDEQRAAETAALRAEMIETNKAFRAEMAAANESLRAEMAEIDKKRADDIREIRAELKGFDKYFHNLTITAMVGVGAAVVGIGVMVVGLLIK